MNQIDAMSREPRVNVRTVRGIHAEGACVVYWMQRAQRSLDNPALELAISIGNELKKPVVVFFAPVPFYPRANYRHYRFLKDGIPGISEGLQSRNVGFVLQAYPNHSLMKFCNQVKPAIVIGDENPMREPEDWRQRAAKELRAPLWTVDADVIVPSRLLEKEQYGARTIRPRIRKLLPEFLIPGKKIKAHSAWKPPKAVRFLAVNSDFLSTWKLDHSVSDAPGWRGGSKQALKILKDFVRQRLESYPENRNCPEINGTSQLSPYLHFGHIGPGTVALAVQAANAPRRAKDAFLEQLIIRRELAINFVKFNPDYDSIDCLEPWAERTIRQHAPDARRTQYNDRQLENAETHDPLWNAAQKQMVLSGWMHNYLRMYWAKKLLEWSPSVAVAYQRAVTLNDRYELDGRDPNGYAGIAWALVGKHDRPWFERPVFGQIRYMSFASTSRKFSCRRYIEQVKALEKGAHA